MGSEGGDRACPFPAIAPDLEAWCRTTGHELVEILRNAEDWRFRVRRGRPCRNDHRVAVRLAYEDVIVCEYLTFMEVMQRADVQLYA